MAWDFVTAREKEEGRRILPKHFTDQYFAARENVNLLKRKYDKKVSVDLLLKDVDNSHRAYKANIDLIDNHVPEKYTRSSIEQMLKF